MAEEDIDYKYWASLDKWTQKEAALLMDGKDPDEHRSVRITFTNPPDGYENAARIAKAISRTDWAQRYGRNHYSLSTSPIYIVDALSSAGWPIPQRLRDEIRSRIEQDPIHQSDGSDEIGVDDVVDSMEPQTTSGGSSSANSRERNTMLKLILGLACGGYGMEPTAEKNRHAKSMREDLERLGIPLDDGTIKKYLDEAKRLRERLVGD